jgi:hypothetical protein
MAAVVLSLFGLIGNPLIVLVIMGLMGYRKRTSFLSRLTVAQISDFSLVLAALGLALGPITADTVGLITPVGIVTIALSPALILHSAPLYARLAPLLSVFERRRPRHKDDAESAAESAIDLVVIDAGRYGGRLVRQGLLDVGDAGSGVRPGHRRAPGRYGRGR